MYKLESMIERAHCRYQEHEEELTHETVVSTEVYRDLGQVHIGDDKLIQYKDAKRIQRTLNAHTSSRLKIFSMEKHREHTPRFRASCINNTANIPLMYVMIKDYKQLQV